MQNVHKPVLLGEVIEGLELKEGLTVVDATLGGAGHSREIAMRIGKGTLIAIDQDPDALERGKEALKGFKCKTHFVHGNFRNLSEHLEGLGFYEVDRVLFDFGLSSNQLELSNRGFSFQNDEPLVMTFGEKSESTITTAETIVNEWSEENLADIIYGFGGEQFSRRIAKAIVEDRKTKRIETTLELAEIVERAVPIFYRRKKIHPATKTFQAIRMAVNDELGSMRDGLRDSWKHLAPKGIIAAISFHELEDREVKRFFKNMGSVGGEILTKKPLTPDAEEIKENPRSRSAKLRLIKKNEN